MINKNLKYISYISLVWLIIIFKPDEYVFFGETAIKILIIVMFSRPLRDIFPKIKILNKIVFYRKELWIIVWVFWLTHVIWYFLDTKLWLDIILNPNIWWLNNYMAWWFVAFFVSIPITLTSNIFSVKIMGWKNWKRLQRLSYIMFFSLLAHIWLVNDEKIWQVVVIWILYILLYVFAYYRNTLKFKK